MKKLLAVAVLLCSIQNTYAIFIDKGTYLTDTTSGFDWLDVTASANFSYWDVSSQFGVGGLFEGWRYALMEEFQVLISNWTGTEVTGFYGQAIHPEGVGSIDGLVAALGSSIDGQYMHSFGVTWDAYYGYAEGEGQDYAEGIIGDYSPVGDRVPSRHYTAWIADNDYSPLANDVSGLRYLYPDGVSGPGLGSFLVRASVPEPTSITLLGLGLAGLGFSRRKIKAKNLS